MDDLPDQAVQIWNKLAASRRIPYEVLAPGAGRSLTNGGFSVLPMAAGFDWRVPDVAGVAALIEKQPAGLRIALSGRQPENCDVLTQVLPLTEKSNYALRFIYRTAGIAPETGLGWRISDPAGKKILAQGESLASESERDGKLPFATPAGSGLVRLTLAYQRALGTIRIEGFIVLRKLRLARAERMLEK